MKQLDNGKTSAALFALHVPIALLSDFNPLFNFADSTKILYHTTPHCTEFSTDIFPRVGCLRTLI